MTRWLLALIVIAVLVAASGFAGLALGAASAAKVLFAIFLGIFLAVLVMSSVSGIDREAAP